jgi:hypothetical protein
VAQLDELRLRGEKLQRDNANTRKEIFDLLQLPEQGVVTVEFGDDGLMSRVDIDAGARKGLSAEQLVHEINAAILRSSPLLAGFGIADADPRAKPAGNGAFLNQLVAAMAAGERTAPPKFANDFETVTVTAALGSILGVECSSSWIGSTPDRLVSEEIVRIARIAALETDTMGRYA